MYIIIVPLCYINASVTHQNSFKIPYRNNVDAISMQSAIANASQH